MTGMELLKEKLIQNYGISEFRAKQIMESQTLARLIEIFAQENGLIESCVAPLVEKQKEDLERKIAQEKTLNHELLKRQAEIEIEKFRLDEKKKQLDKQRAELEEMEKRITAAETPEERDRQRRYEMYKRDAIIQSTQNASVYNAGLASILSGVPVWQFGTDGGDTDESIPVKRKNEKRNGTVRI